MAPKIADGEVLHSNEKSLLKEEVVGVSYDDQYTKVVVTELVNVFEN